MESKFLEWSNDGDPFNDDRKSVSIVTHTYYRSSVSKKGDILLQIDSSLVPSSQSAAVVQNEPLGGDPVHG